MSLTRKDNIYWHQYSAFEANEDSMQSSAALYEQISQLSTGLEILLKLILPYYGCTSSLSLKV